MICDICIHWIWLDNIKHAAYFFKNIYFDCYFSTESQGKLTRKSVKKTSISYDDKRRNDKKKYSLIKIR